MSNDELHYPNLGSCRVELSSSTVGSKPPVKLPRDCLDAVSNASIPPPYDFSLGECIIVLHR